MKPFLIRGALACVMLVQAAVSAAAGDAKVTDASFRCMNQMTPVRGFYVDNLNGPKTLQQTLKVAQSKDGGSYPAGSVVQLIPTEAMVKLPAGSSPATNDWEFFELDVDTKGTRIHKRGFVDVVNKFGGNCLACHAQAQPKWDMVCEQGHGCAPIPLTPAMARAVQRSDPRCTPATPLTAEDLNALKDLQAMLKNFKP